jgi:hypothetical protein
MRQTLEDNKMVKQSGRLCIRSSGAFFSCANINISLIIQALRGAHVGWTSKITLTLHAYSSYSTGWLLK